MEVIPGLLYIGNNIQGHSDYIQKDLKIQGKISCCTEEISEQAEGPGFMRISISDDNGMYRQPLPGLS